MGKNGYANIFLKDFQVIQTHGRKANCSSHILRYFISVYVYAFVGHYAFATLEFKLVKFLSKIIFTEKVTVKDL